MSALKTSEPDLKSLRELNDFAEIMHQKFFPKLEPLHCDTPSEPGVIRFCGQPERPFWDYAFEVIDQVLEKLKEENQ